MHTGVADPEFSNQATSVQRPTGWVLRGGQVPLYNQATSVHQPTGWVLRGGHYTQVSRHSSQLVAWVLHEGRVATIQRFHCMIRPPLYSSQLVGS